MNHKLTAGFSKTALTMTEKEKKRRSINWNHSERSIEDTDADVLLILDCCDSGTLTHHGRSRGRRFELLAACEHGKTTRFPGTYSFTRALTWALEQLADESPFSTCKLRHKIAEEAPDFSGLQDQSPVLSPRFPASTRSTPDEHIMIEILGQSADSTFDNLKMSREDKKQIGDHVDFRFHFSGTFDKEQLERTAKELKDLIRADGLSLRRIGLLKKGNAVQQALATWRLVLQKRSSPITASPLTPVGSDEMLEVPATDGQTHLLPGPSIPIIKVPPIKVPKSEQFTTRVKEDEETPLLPLPPGSSSGQQPSSGVSYHFGELLKCLLSETFRCFQRRKIAKVSHN